MVGCGRLKNGSVAIRKSCWYAGAAFFDTICIEYADFMTRPDPRQKPFVFS